MKPGSRPRKPGKNMMNTFRPANVIEQLVTEAESDIRQMLNILSTWKLLHDAIDFNEGQHL